MLTGQTNGALKPERTAKSQGFMARIAALLLLIGGSLAADQEQESRDAGHETLRVCCALGLKRAVRLPG